VVEGPVLSRVLRSLLSVVEACPELSRRGLVEGPVLSRVLSVVEGPVLSLSKGSILSLSKGSILSLSKGLS